MDVEPTQVVAALLDRLEAGWRLRIETLHDLRVGPSWGFGQRQVPEWHLLYVRAGRGWYHLDGRALRLEAGLLLLLAPGFPHAARPDPADPPTIVPLRCTLEPPAGAPAWRPPAVALHRRLDGAAAAAAAAACDGVRRWWQAEGALPWARLRQQALIAQLLLELVAAGGEGQAAARDPFERLRGQLVTHPHERPSVAAMARGVGLSEKHFIRAFKQRYGETPRACQIRLRCERAAYLLAETAAGVGEIAAELGYPDCASFSKQFKGVMGASPGSWRASERSSGVTRGQGL